MINEKAEQFHDFVGSQQSQLGGAENLERRLVFGRCFCRAVRFVRGFADRSLENHAAATEIEVILRETPARNY